MSALEVRRANAISKRHILQQARRVFHSGTLSHLVRIAISLVLLPLDNSILFVAVFLTCLSPFFRRLETLHRRKKILQDLQFRPKTVLVTGVNTPHGLRVARCWYNEGHRVVGADITDARFSSGESMSRAFVAYYRIPKAQYVSRLLDIVLREKVDIWIPCARDASVVDDAMAKQAIESQTSCKCTTLDTELAIQWGQLETLIPYLTERDLPVVENHQVQSRDSIHKILHRSPTKVYHMRKPTPPIETEEAIVLPKRTLSSTYTEVSQIQVSKDSPWLMQQHVRLGEFIAELLIVCGHVTAIMIRPASRDSVWGCSPLHEGLSAAIHRVVDSFASKSGSRVTAHLAVRLMVDEELTSNSVRYEVNIADCTQDAAAVTHLLRDTPPHALVNGYLAALSEDGIPKASVNAFSSEKLSRLPSAYEIIKSYDVRKLLPALYPLAQGIDWAVDEASKLLVFWKNWRFSVADPLPWWWHTHVYWPLRELDLLLHSTKQADASRM